jgi:hypothetical protein
MLGPFTKNEMNWFSHLEGAYGRDFLKGFVGVYTGR